MRIVNKDFTDVTLSDCTDVTDEVQEHFDYNEWTADQPDFVFANMKIWDGGMGVLLMQDNATGRYYVND